MVDCGSPLGHQVGNDGGGSGSTDHALMAMSERKQGRGA